ncbi:MAG: EamA family transporter [Alkalispirochaeta sp.]
MSGITISIIAGVFLGLFQSLHGKAEELSLRTATMMLLVFAAILSNALTLATGGIEAYRALTLPGVLYFAAAGAIHFSGGWMFIGISQRRVGVGITGLLVGATPVFTAIIAWLVIREGLTPTEIGGVVLVIIGVGIASWR